MNFEVTCYQIGFKNCNLKICDIYLTSKNFFDQNISQDSRKSGELLWYIIPRNFLSNLVKIQKKRTERDYQNWQISTNEIEN